MKTMEKAKATEGKQVGIRLDGALLSELESLQKTLIPNGDLTLTGDSTHSAEGGSSGER